MNKTVGVGVAAACLFLCGCGLNHSSKGPVAQIIIENDTPKTLATSMHQAIERRNYDAIAGCIAPAYRGPFRDILSSSKKYSAKMLQTADLVDKRIDPRFAQKLRQEEDQTYHGLLPSPLQGAAVNGRINSERVSVEMEGDRALVKVDGKYTEFSGKFFIVRTAQGWYAQPFGEAETFAGEAKHMAEAYKQFMKVLDKIQGQIKSGKITRDNVEQAFWGGNPR